ncbi:nucleoside monophosphate kinase [candidate division WWE3 bacterium]|nr:nucleoside monophosphate kinase [candidate division WWE3 bacterium]
MTKKIKGRRINWLLLFGAAGAGKGTQAARIREILEKHGLRVALLATGDLFRNPPGTLDRGVVSQISENMKKGVLVDDAVTMVIAGEALNAKLEEDPDWVILDGLPRNVFQLAAVLFAMTSIGLAHFFTFELAVADSLLIPRLQGRKTCKSCGKVHPASTDLAGACPKCGKVTLFIRDDDSNPKSIRNRLGDYRKTISSVLDALRKLISTLELKDRFSVETVDGSLPEDSVTDRIIKHLDLQDQPA